MADIINKQGVNMADAVMTVVIKDQNDNLADFIKYADYMWPGRPDGTTIQQWVNLKVKDYIKKLFVEARRLKDIEDAANSASLKPDLVIE